MKQEIEVDGVKYIREGTVKPTVTTFPKPKKGMEYCIVRTFSAGVFAGYWDRKVKGSEGIIYNSRRIWYWDGAASLSQLAMEGTKKPVKCKFPCEVKETDLKNVIEVIPCTEKAKQSIKGVPVWEK